MSLKPLGNVISTAVSQAAGLFELADKMGNLLGGQEGRISSGSDKRFE